MTERANIGRKIMAKRREKITQKLDRRTFLTGVAGAGLAMGAFEITMPGSALAAGYPKKPITVVVMYSAGGGTDTIMRALGAEMAKAKGWRVNVINKPGAVGGVATKSNADHLKDFYAKYEIAEEDRLTEEQIRQISQGEDDRSNIPKEYAVFHICLLYTSDAADE